MRRLLTLSVLATACASSAPPPGAADVPRLEAAVRANAGSTPLRVQLAAAYIAATMPERAVAMLEPVVAANPADAVAALHLGIAWEDLGRPADARRAYTAFLQGAGASPLRDRIEDRLALLARLELRQAVQASLARERELAAAAPPPRTVGVFPFLFAGRDSTLRPLGTAFAELLSTDLAQTNRLRVVQRVRVQALLDEIELAAAGYVDPATAARAGHMVGASNIVQGRVDGGAADLGVQALVVATLFPRDTAARPISGGGGLSRLFDIEKQIALDVFARLGIQLTEAERQRVNRRATQNVQALLAFGFGLEAQDAGRWAEAAGHFGRALQLDPGFDRARELAEETERLQASAGTRTSELAGLAAAEFDLRLSAWQRRQLGLEVLDGIIPDPLLRDPTVEVLGLEGIGRGTTIDFIIRRPGGGE